MPAVAPGVLDLVASEGEGALHLLVGHPPVAAVDVQVLAAVLQEDADRLGLVFADQGRIVVAAAQADVGADGAEDATEGVGPLPGGGEGADGAATGAADAAVVAVLRQLDRPAVCRRLLLDLRQQLFQDEAGVIVAEAVAMSVACVRAFELTVPQLVGDGWSCFLLFCHDMRKRCNRHALHVD